MLTRLSDLRAKLAKVNRQNLIGLAVAAILLAIGIFALGYSLASQQTAASPSAAASGHPMKPNQQMSMQTTPVLGFSRPVSIKIPAINVSSKIIKIGKNSNGTIAIPKGGQRNYPAWYKYSAAPGEFGAAVIEGHLDTQTGPSVFFNLGKLKPNDKIMIKRADGKLLTFKVTATMVYNKAMFPTSMFYAGSGQGAELHLTTCAGDFNSQSNSYQKNLAIYSKLVSVKN